MSAKKKILVVEDERQILESLKDFFILQSYEVHTAATGDQGLALGLAENPDLIVLDIMLPGKDGYEVCQRLKRHRKTKHIPIIMLSAKSSVPDIDKGFRARADGYVTKPFDPARLHAKIKKLLKEDAEDVEES